MLRLTALEEECNYYSVVQCDRAYRRTCHRVVLEIRLSLIDGKNDKNLILTSLTGVVAIRLLKSMN